MRIFRGNRIPRAGRLGVSLSILSPLILCASCSNEIDSSSSPRAGSSDSAKGPARSKPLSPGTSSVPKVKPAESNAVGVESDADTPKAGNSAVEGGTAPETDPVPSMDGASNAETGQSAPLPVVKAPVVPPTALPTPVAECKEGEVTTKILFPYAVAMYNCEKSNAKHVCVGGKWELDPLWAVRVYGFKPAHYLPECRPATPDEAAKGCGEFNMANGQNRYVATFATSLVPKGQRCKLELKKSAECVNGKFRSFLNPRTIISRCAVAEGTETTQCHVGVETCASGAHAVGVNPVPSLAGKNVEACKALPEKLTWDCKNGKSVSNSIDSYFLTTDPKGFTWTTHLQRFDTGCTISGDCANALFKDEVADNYQNSAFDKQRCLARAKEYHAACGNSAGSRVWATYFQHGAKAAKSVYMGPTGICMPQVKTCQNGSVSVTYAFPFGHSSHVSHEACKASSQALNVQCGNIKDYNIGYIYRAGSAVTDPYEICSGCKNPGEFEVHGFL